MEVSSSKSSFLSNSACVIELLDGTPQRLGNIIAPRDAPSPTVLIVLRHFGSVI